MAQIGAMMATPMRRIQRKMRSPLVFEIFLRAFTMMSNLKGHERGQGRGQGREGMVPGDANEDISAAKAENANESEKSVKTSSTRSLPQ